MKHKILIGLFAAAAMSFAVVPPALAQVTAAQCNFAQGGGSFVPGLRVEIDGREFQFVIGERGLTTSDLYSKDRIEAFVRRSFFLGQRPIMAVLACGAPRNEEDPSGGPGGPITPFDADVEGGGSTTNGGGDGEDDTGNTGRDGGEPGEPTDDEGPGEPGDSGPDDGPTGDTTEGVDLLLLPRQ